MNHTLAVPLASHLGWLFFYLELQLAFTTNIKPLSTVILITWDCQIPNLLPLARSAVKAGLAFAISQ